MGSTARSVRPRPSQAKAAPNTPSASRARRRALPGARRPRSTRNSASSGAAAYFTATFAALQMAAWALPLDPVTNVAIDAWAAARLWRLLRADRLPARAPDGACYPAPPAP